MRWLLSIYLSVTVIFALVAPRNSQGPRLAVLRWAKLVASPKASSCHGQVLSGSISPCNKRNTSSPGKVFVRHRYTQPLQTQRNDDGRRMGHIHRAMTSP
ncbi:hypothetical protein BDV98DRAFT_58216 [Pterulicium gracile]|uniref:Secreted protein n=1 Tax=Pterulicium gracile TaxID=1884261 RepID=A0A5C3QJT8_9AGAR|nr:hypothetical protein BDV98DRAFT_58216 [Pterula gracilis]